MEEENKLTIEDIKQIADTRRKLKNPTKYNIFVKEQMEKLKDENISQKDKLSTISKKWKEQKEPLPPPKETKKRIKKEPEFQPEPEPEIKSEPEPNGPEPELKPEPINNDFITLQENINSIKQLLEEVMKSKSKPKPKPRPTLKRVNKTLDLTINDKEIEDIINTDKKKDKTQDEKLKAFLDAMTKK